MSDFNYNFCTRDPRHPTYEELKECLGDDMGEPGVDCSCNSCFYGRHQLAVRIAELEHQLAGCTCPTVAQLRRQELVSTTEL